MEIVHTEKNRGKQAIIVDGYVYRHANTLKNGDVVYVCSINKKCNKSITTDLKGVAVVKTKNEHSCGKEPDPRENKSRLLRVRVWNKSGDVTKRPGAVIRNEPKDINENKLHRTDFRNVSLSLYGEHRKHLPTLPKSREDTRAAIKMIDTMTSKNEQFLIGNDQESGIIIFSTETNVTCLCNDVEELFIDGTFKCCARHFYQLHTIHGGKKGNYVPLVFALLPCKSEMCYQKMWKFITDYCTERNVVLSPRIIHINFEKAMHNAVLSTFPNTSIMCCRFHLGQNFWKKIQSLGLSPMYKDKSSDIGK